MLSWNYRKWQRLYLKPITIGQTLFIAWHKNNYFAIYLLVLNQLVAIVHCETNNITELTCFNLFYKCILMNNSTKYCQVAMVGTCVHLFLTPFCSTRNKNGPPALLSVCLMNFIVIKSRLLAQIVCKQCEHIFSLYTNI